jgi:hypothetical protein
MRRFVRCATRSGLSDDVLIGTDGLLVLGSLTIAFSNGPATITFRGFNIMPVEFIAYRRGPKPAPFEFRDGTSGWTITIDMNSKDVVAAR